jgi:hypothetical protein
VIPVVLEIYYSPGYKGEMIAKRAFHRVSQSFVRVP